MEQEIQTNEYGFENLNWGEHIENKTQRKLINKDQLKKIISDNHRITI